MNIMSTAEQMRSQSNTCARARAHTHAHTQQSITQIQDLIQFKRLVCLIK